MIVVGKSDAHTCDCTLYGLDERLYVCINEFISQDLKLTQIMNPESNNNSCYYIVYGVCEM